MKDFNFIFIRLAVYLIIGIVAGFYFSIGIATAFLISGFAFLIFTFSFLRARRMIFSDAIFGISSLLLVFCIGVTVTSLSIPSNQNKHFLNLEEEFGNEVLIANISEELKPTEFSERFILETESLLRDDRSVKIKGKILVNIRKDSINGLTFKPGMRILLPWNPLEFNSSLNPFQFDYRDYMRRLKVERQINLKASQIQISASNNASLKSIAWQIREKIINKLKSHDFGPNEIAVYQALILGQRREISNKLYQDYAAAGAIHILAISGLHIGILLYFLNFLLQWLNRFKNGRIIRTIVLILLLWSFALITGLNPSVVRAVTMFSFIAIGLQLKRKTSVLNSLFVSLFFLLILNPYYIFQVGFQLSYLAVFSIIIFQPKIYKLLKSESQVLDYFWKLCSVSLAAQIGVIPISIFYFHQFPGMFLISNLVILPFLGIILAFGILVIFLASIGQLPEFMVRSFDFLLNSMNKFIEWIASKEGLIIGDIHVLSYQVLAIYMFIFSLIIIFRKQNYFSLSFLLISILCIQSATLLSKAKIPDSEIVIFHKSRQSVITVKNSNHLDIYSAVDKSDLSLIKDYTRERNIKSEELKSMPEIFYLADQLTLIIDTAENYAIPNFKPDLIILQNSPKVNLERIIDELNPKEIIADGSNYNSIVKRWKSSSQNKKIPFHHTGEKGAYIIISAQ
ncbi:ComEC/Rec2 family competence protein [Christiangramia sp. SM2212]|uniref:ComEC/Rec2 family competence protein n=1 Tax=Christiangramia sediminicola TaxID=3073267 RepID=A0ABU1EVD5_9FLAO|nr:ComEC/Rec2 family competence protein [Christiangramia sp. SM2212]MDR5591954.1 ComEC/Rec2 family competence protein [Christiangramia sp. SM2212]